MFRCHLLAVATLVVLTGGLHAPLAKAQPLPPEKAKAVGSRDAELVKAVEFGKK